MPIEGNVSFIYMCRCCVALCFFCEGHWLFVREFSILLCTGSTPHKRSGTIVGLQREPLMSRHIAAKAAQRGAKHWTDVCSRRLLGLSSSTTFQPQTRKKLCDHSDQGGKSTALKNHRARGVLVSVFHCIICTFTALMF